MPPPTQDEPRYDTLGSKYTSHLDIRQNLGCISLITWTWGFGSLVGAFEFLPSIRGWGMLMLGIALISIAVAIWRAKEWGRLAAAFIASVGCAVVLGMVSIEAIKDRSFPSLFDLSQAAVLGLAAWGSFQPSTKRQFAAAREAIARTKAEKAQ
jgi:hypothetical protein